MYDLLAGQLIVECPAQMVVGRGLPTHLNAGLSREDSPPHPHSEDSGRLARYIVWSWAFFVSVLTGWFYGAG